MIEQYFNGTCDLFDISTCPGLLLEKYLDPCSCYNYYRCTNNYEMVLETCAGGTAWDYETGACNHKNDVLFNQNCDEDIDVWTRCNVTEARTVQLRQICTNSGTTQQPMTSTSPEDGTYAAISDNVNPGIIIGSVAAGALIAVLVLVAIYVLYKRRDKNKINKGRSSTIAQNPEYFESGQAEDPYAVINEAHIRPAGYTSNPDYNGTSGGGTLNQANGSCTNAGVVDLDDDVEYDNSEGRIAGSGYTNTLRRSNRDYETPTSVRDNGSGLQTNDTPSDVTNKGSSDNVTNRDDMSGGNLNVDENANKNSSDDGGGGLDSEFRGGNESKSYTLSGSDGLVGHTHEDAPDYYVLEKSEF